MTIVEVRVNKFVRLHAFQCVIFTTSTLQSKNTFIYIKELYNSISKIHAVDFRIHTLADILPFNNFVRVYCMDFMTFVVRAACEIILKELLKTILYNDFRRISFKKVGERP